LISIFTILGIAFGVTVLIISLSVINGFEEVIQKKIIGFNSHLIISGFGKQNIFDNKDIETKIANIAGSDYSSIYKFISRSAILSYKNNTDGIVVNAVEPQNFNIAEFIKIGKKNYPRKNVIIIGKKLADRYKIQIGDKIALFFSDKNISTEDLVNVGIKQFTVNGIYESNFAQYDDMNCYINLEVAKEIFNMPNEISGYNLRLNNLRNIDLINDKLQKELNYPYYARSIFQEYQNIFTWISLQKKPIPIVLGLITIVAVFNIIGTILMIILEKTNEIGILSSLGAKRSGLIKIFMSEGLILSIIGIFVGNILTAVIILLQTKLNIITLPGEIYFLSKVPLDFDFLIFMLVNIVTFGFSIITSFIPSYIASRINIVKAIRFE